MKKIIVLLSILICFSCFTDSNDLSEKTANSQLLKSVYLDGQLLYNFEYYPDKKIRSQTSFSGEAISHFLLYEYTNDTVYITISGIFSSKTKSYKTEANTVKLLEYDSEDNLLFFYFNTYSASNCGLKETKSYTRFGQLYIITEYKYIDSNCSYTSKKELSNGIQKNNYAILKDDKNNVLTSLNPRPSFQKKHNTIEYKQWDANDNLLLSQSYSSIFEYDDNNYPIQEIRTLLSGTIKNYTYEYY